MVGNFRTLFFFRLNHQSIHSTLLRFFFCSFSSSFFWLEMKSALMECNQSSKNRRRWWIINRRTSILPEKFAVRILYIYNRFSKCTTAQRKCRKNIWNGRHRMPYCLGQINIATFSDWVERMSIKSRNNVAHFVCCSFSISRCPCRLCSCFGFVW